MNGQTPPRGNQSNHRGNGGRPCPDGCKCGRHNKVGRPKVTKSQCPIIDADGRCTRIGYTSENVCKTHHTRLVRYGTYERRLRKKELRIATEQFANCLCTHSITKHQSLKGRCITFGCDCVCFVTTDPVFLRSILDKLKRVGFKEVLNKQGKCDKCSQWISIGAWHDPIVLRRALIHSRQLCPAISRKRHPA